MCLQRFFIDIRFITFLAVLLVHCLKRVFLLPSPTDFERYISSNDAIIIRPLISESPLQLVEGINTPTIEKVLVGMAAQFLGQK